MLNHSSAKQYEETPHVNKATKNKTLNLNDRNAQREETPYSNKSTKHKSRSLNGTSNTVSNTLKRRNGKVKPTISNALKRRARSVIKDRSIDAESRALIRYALETNDPWLAELVARRCGRNNHLYCELSQTPAPSEDDSNEEKIEALAEMICRADEVSTGTR